MTCLNCNATLSELEKEYGRINRAHTTIIAALKALKIYAPKSTKQIAFAAAVIATCEARLERAIKEKQNEKINDKINDNDDVLGVPV